MARRTKEEALQTRNDLIDAAELVFESRGVAGASLQDVFIGLTGRELRD